MPPSQQQQTELRSILAVSLPQPGPSESDSNSQSPASSTTSSASGIRPLPNLPLPNLPIFQSDTLPTFSPGSTVLAIPVDANGAPVPGAFIPETNSAPEGTAMIQFFNVSTRPNPPPLTAVKFAPLPELAPRKRKNTTPLGIAARGQMMARRRAMLAYGGQLPKDHPLNQVPNGNTNTNGANENVNSNGTARYGYSEDQSPRGTPEDDLEDPFVALGRMVKGVWRKVSNKELRESGKDGEGKEGDSTSSGDASKSGSVKKKKSFKSKSSPLKPTDPPPPLPLAESSASSSSSSQQPSDKTIPPSPSQLSPTKRTIRKSALVVADEADRAGAIAPLVHEPDENGGETPRPLPEDGTDEESEQDENWQTATIRPVQNDDEDATDSGVESGVERSRHSSFSTSEESSIPEVSSQTVASPASDGPSTPVPSTWESLGNLDSGGLKTPTIATAKT